MSRSPGDTVRNLVGLLATLLAFTSASPLLAQDAADRAQQNASDLPDPDEDPNVIDILVRPPPSDPDPLANELCKRDQEVGVISGEIIVCAPARDNSEYRTLNREDARRRYAEETAYRDDPRTPIFIPGCKDQGNPAGCIGFGKVPPKALIIDVEALPEAPKGSDADRIGRGLPPIGQDDSSIPTPTVAQPETGPVLHYEVPVLAEPGELNLPESAEPAVDP